MMRVLIWVQHLWGVGHLRRMTRIADALGRRGAAVTLVSGGLPVPAFETGHFALRRLSPVQTGDAAFSTLRRQDGQDADGILMAGRTVELLGIFHATQPDILITELFPFGRRKFRREMLALLQAARGRRPRPLILSSLRDIVEPPSDPARNRAYLGWVSAYYDALLVHGDPGFLKLEASAAWLDQLRLPIHYSGYAGPAPPLVPTQKSPDERPGILVSTGGGRGGARLLDLAAQAARLAGGGLRWRLVGGWHAESPASEQNGTFYSGCEIVREPARDDLPALMGAAALSVSRAGYNTVVEGLAAGIPLILVPDTAGGQREQTMRAEALALRNLALHLPEAQLTPQILARTVRACLELPPPRHRIRLNGAVVTARIIENLWLGQPAQSVAP
jgi:predicted glycosyltransferase